jgi:hypothetical protein
VKKTIFLRKSSNTPEEGMAGRQHCHLHGFPGLPHRPVMEQPAKLIFFLLAFTHLAPVAGPGDILTKQFPARHHFERRKS